MFNRDIHKINLQIEQLTARVAELEGKAAYSEYARDYFWGSGAAPSLKDFNDDHYPPIQGFNCPCSSPSIKDFNANHVSIVGTKNMAADVSEEQNISGGTNATFTFYPIDDGAKNDN